MVLLDGHCVVDQGLLHLMPFRSNPIGHPGDNYPVIKECVELLRRVEALASYMIMMAQPTRLGCASVDGVSTNLDRIASGTTPT
jgi:hypothetical protein